MNRIRRTKRVAFGALACLLLFGQLGQQVGAQQDEPDNDEVAEALQGVIDLYMSEIYDLDLNGDGEPDVVDSDDDGTPEFAEIPEGEPGQRDITPGNPLFLAPITSDLEALGLSTVVDNGDGSRLLGECGGMALSFTDEGELKDWAVGVPSNEGGGPDGQLVDLFGDNFGERAFTSGNPFQVYDRVIYFGRLPGEGDGPEDHDWEIRTAGISLDKGGDPNSNLNNRNAGEVNLADDVPGALRFNGIFPIEGELTAQNGLSCLADGWVEFVGGNPLLSTPSAIAAVLGGAGLIGLLFNARPAITWKA